LRARRINKKNSSVIIAANNFGGALWRQWHRSEFADTKCAWLIFSQSRPAVFLLSAASFHPHGRSGSSNKFEVSGMRPHLKAFPAISLSLISAALIFFGAALNGGSAANAAGTSAGTVSLRGSADAAPQNLGVKSIGVVRTGSSSGAASVLCRTVDGSAKAGSDYTAVSQVLRWAGGDMTEKYCPVALSDALPFSGRKTFLVELSGATGAALGTPSSTFTIYGNATSGQVALSAPTFTVAQNAGSVTVTVARTGGSTGWAAVDYATANGTAIAGTDYASERGMLAWASGDAAPKSFTIPISNAKPFSGKKTLAVAIAGAIDARLGSANTSAIVTINGDAAATTAATGTATVSWTAPTLDTNGSPLTDLAGYNLHYGKTPTTMTNVIAVNDPASGSYVIGNLAPGTWFFAVVAYNAQAVESTLSSIVSKTL
jgi:Calx-beta domain